MDQTTGWVFERARDGTCTKIEPIAERLEEDVQHLRMQLANPLLTRSDILRRSGWTPEYLKILRHELRRWEEASVRATSTEVFLSQVLATLERQSRELEFIAADPATPVSIRVRAREVIARNSLAAFGTAQSAGFVFKAAEKRELRVDARVVTVDTTPEALATAARKSAELIHRNFTADGFRRPAIDGEALLALEAGESLSPPPTSITVELVQVAPPPEPPPVPTVYSEPT